jgi:glycosyltransferase involved in cell wall biosynthesis
MNSFQNLQEYKRLNHATTLEPQSADTSFAKTVEISVVLPAYNEANHIGKVVKELVDMISGVASSYELVVVDDGSTDETFEKVEAMSFLNRSIIPIRNPLNMGKGAAVKSAADVTRGEVVVLLDADMDIAPSTLITYAETLRVFDLCIASKRHPKSEYEAPLIRKFLSLSFNALVRLMTGVAYSDSQTGLKAMKGVHFRQIMNLICVKRYAYDVEILAVAQLLKLRVAELPVNIRQVSLFDRRSVMYMLIDLLGIAYRLRVIRWYQKNLKNSIQKYKPIIPI